MKKNKNNSSVGTELVSYIPTMIIGVITIVAATLLSSFVSYAGAEMDGSMAILLGVLSTVVSLIGYVTLAIISFLMLYTVIKWGVRDGNKKEDDEKTETKSEADLNPEEFEK